MEWSKNGPAWKWDFIAQFPVVSGWSKNDENISNTQILWQNNFESTHDSLEILQGKWALIRWEVLIKIQLGQTRSSPWSLVIVWSQGMKHCLALTVFITLGSNACSGKKWLLIGLSWLVWKPMFLVKSQPQTVKVRFWPDKKQMQQSNQLL